VEIVQEALGKIFWLLVHDKIGLGFKDFEAKIVGFRETERSVFFIHEHRIAEKLLFADQKPQKTNRSLP
jgi:hypothetical protein